MKGGDYPPQNIRSIILSIQMYLHLCRINWKFLSEDDPIFVDLYNVIDNVVKDYTEQDMGKVNSCSSVTNTMEEEMWNTGVLLEHTPAQLLDTIMYLIGVNCALGGEVMNIIILEDMGSMNKLGLGLTPTISNVLNFKPM